ncbi:pyridoxamine 5'-phosphate oxidase family protein [Chamaesiphon sp. VAR_48_metabat_403]|uniref:pyridoxamine 5'-phosphate oxidase family protein n=1 Tax=Chamaesiphon sp. VAR_48_metabat_403 TaxID=2964700 RepID=UPI00286DF7E1|nr:pyridoxamine 5'-phosphate oxidase family protein [Chamaesiphon sp. VAR_48_metabat_403]
MAKFYSQLDAQLCKFIGQQQLFFTATAPLDGRINLSPKGIDTFRCLDYNQVGYLDLTGSGNETAAHLQQNGRMTIMFCSFTDKPLILRIYGTGEVVRPDTDRWDNLIDKFADVPGKRQLILLQVESVQTSCGYGVPIYELQSERSTLIDWAVNKGTDGVRNYQLQKNQTSIDGLVTNIES